MKIEEATQTVGGHPWRFLVDCGDYVIGAYMTEGGNWNPGKWDKRGEPCFTLIEDLNLDLTDWKDEIPWKNLDPRIISIARNEDRIWKGFSFVPRKDISIWICDTYGSIEFTIMGLYIPSAPEDWTQTLAIRPGTEEDSFF